MFLFELACDRGSEFMNFDFTHFLLFELRDEFTNLEEIFFFPFCSHHGKSDTDRLFRVLKHFIKMWLQTNHFLESRQLRPALKEAIRMNHKVRDQQGNKNFREYNSLRFCSNIERANHIAFEVYQGKITKS